MVPGGRRKLCKAVNLSATGVFIETTNLGLRKGQQVIAARQSSRTSRAAGPA
jgi:hypothetical protein